MDLMSESVSVLDEVLNDAKTAHENYLVHLKHVDVARDGREGVYHPLLNNLSLAWTVQNEYSKARTIIESHGDNPYLAYKALSAYAPQQLEELNKVSLDNSSDPMDKIRLTGQKHVWKTIDSQCN